MFKIVERCFDRVIREIIRGKYVGISLKFNKPKNYIGGFGGIIIQMYIRNIYIPQN